MLCNCKADFEAEHKAWRERRDAAGKRFVSVIKVCGNVAASAAASASAVPSAAPVVMSTPPRDHDELEGKLRAVLDKLNTFGDIHTSQNKDKHLQDVKAFFALMEEMRDICRNLSPLGVAEFNFQSCSPNSDVGKIYVQGMYRHWSYLGRSNKTIKKSKEGTRYLGLLSLKDINYYKDKSLAFVHYRTEVEGGDLSISQAEQRAKKK